MQTPLHSRIPLTSLALSLAALACSLLQVPASPTPLPSAQAGPSNPTSAPPTRAPATGLMTLTLPDGQKMELHARCSGVNAGEYLDVRASNTDDVNDPDRVEAQVGGDHQSAGDVQNMFVAIFIGPQNAGTFAGNNPAVTLMLEADGSGHFSDIGIINIAVNSPTYQYNVESKFSAEWKC